jgi:antitoxin component YwqK of YwqJK toxin-antitoxin module
MPLIYYEGMENHKHFQHMLLVLLIWTITLSGCSSIVLVEKSSQDGQERYYIKNAKFSRDTVYQGLFCQWYPNGTKKYEVTYKNGKKDGHEAQWDAFGYKIREAQYKNDQKNGLEIFWIGNGVKKREIQFKNGLQSGLEITYSDSGQKVKEELYLNGKKDGIEYGLDAEGRKIYEVTYKAGKKNGMEIFYDYSTGQKPQSTVVNWVDGNVVK